MPHRQAQGRAAGGRGAGRGAWDLGEELEHTGAAHPRGRPRGGASASRLGGVMGDDVLSVSGLSFSRDHYHICTANVQLYAITQNKVP